MTTLVSGGALPTGAILPFGGPSTAVPPGFLLCNGAEINRNDFAALFAVIATYWGAGNGTTTFRIPTTQGLLLRGVAYGSGNDPDRASRNAVQAGGQTGDEVGSFQNWRMQSHQHASIIAWADGGSRANGFAQANGNALLNTSGNRAIGKGGGASDNFGGVFNGNLNTNGTAVGGGRVLSTSEGSSQTVGQNVYVNFIIKF